LLDSCQHYLELVEFITPKDLSEDYDTDANQEVIQRTASIHGADEVKSAAARVNIEGHDYLFCFDAVRYGNEWYLLSFGGNVGVLLGISALAGGVAPM
jgi:hypothetical protein